MRILVSLILILLGLTALARGWRRGFVWVLIDFTGLILATLIASSAYLPAAKLLHRLISVPQSLLNLGTFILIWVIIEALYRLAIHAIRLRRPILLKPVKTPAGHLGGAMVSLAQFVMVATLSLLVILALPLNGGLKTEIESAPGSKQLIAAGSRYQQTINKLLADLSETLTFLTVKTESTEVVYLGFRTENVTVDELSERVMLASLNHERTSRGLKALTIDAEITAVARAHSRDMLRRGYFSHVNLDGRDPFKRMKEGEVDFLSAGENLALAPTVSLAHNGLMNSPGHRANILEPAFGRVGIGVIDAGVYGKMFTQNFAD